MSTTVAWWLQCWKRGRRCPKCRMAGRCKFTKLSRPCILACNDVWIWFCISLMWFVWSKRCWCVGLWTQFSSLSSLSLMTYELKVLPYRVWVWWVFVCVSLCHLRDYFDEIQASINIGAAEWKMQNLCVWNDLVIKKQLMEPNADGTPELTLDDAEADLESAEFAAVRTKLAKLGLNMMVFYFNVTFKHDAVWLSGHNHK